MSVQKIYSKVISGKKLLFQDALDLINTDDSKLEELLKRANDLREHFFGNQVMLCSIVNAKSGKCSEDCSFCSQASVHKTQTEEYPLLTKDKLLKVVDTAKNSHAGCFSIVTSGKGFKDDSKEFKQITETIKDIAGVRKCASLGIISKEQAKALKEAGLEKFHHNLETAESFFPKMCSTHTYQERIETIRNAKSVGLKVCVGGIFGIGETKEQRVELGMAIAELDVDSVPINIVHPIEGTRVFGKTEKMSTEDVLRLVATYRFIMPDKVIGVFGGREYSLGDKQKMIFKAGANSILIGNYLTVKGNTVEKDLQMLAELRLEPVSDVKRKK